MASMAKVLGLIFANMHEQTLPESVSYTHLTLPTT